MRRARLLLSILALTALLAGLLPVVSGAQESLPVATRKVARISYDGSPEIASQLASRYDVWQVQPEKGFIEALVSSEEEAELRAAGYQVEVERVIEAGINAPLDPRYYYFDDYLPNSNDLYIVDLMDQVAAAYPGITELFEIGTAWEGLHGGHARPLLVLRITNEDPAFGPIADKPAFFLHANVHAREVTTPELAIRYIKHLTSGYLGQGGYGLDPDVTWLVDWYRVYVEVTTNPDGLAVNEADSGAYWRKNVDSDDGCSTSYGVDLNRNHSFKWGCCGGSSPDPCAEEYRGPARASEPETESFQTFVLNEVFFDQNGPNGDDELPNAAPPTTTGILLSLHSYADEILWPWGFPPYNTSPNYAQLQAIGRKLGSINGLDPTGTIGYPVDGGTRDWIYGKLGIPAYSFEVGPNGGMCTDFIPPYECQDGLNGAPRNFWAENRPAFIYMHKLARTPYMTVYGPDSINVAATPGAVAPGEPTEISALVVDQRYSGDPLQPIAGAEYFVDAPGDDGAGTAMSPVDGSWGETSEEAAATLDTGGLALGRHYVLVHGRNSNGDWGPYTAAFLYIVEPGSSPVIEGYVRDSATNAPLDAVVTAGVFNAGTDPATGYYSMTVVSGTYDMTAVAPGYADGFAYDVVAHDYQVVQQNFMLNMICQTFADDVENGPNGWTTGGTPNNWAITTEDSHSPSHSWTDSPGGSYPSGANTWVQSPLLDLTDNGGITLNFWHKYDTESGYDYAHVEYSTNGGSSWTEAMAYDGNQSSWIQAEMAIPVLDHQPNARLRFRLTSDSSINGDGWHIDDITLLADSGCIPPTAPIAEFTSNSPVMLDDPMLFTNASSGYPAPTYEWDFGDGIGASTDPNPTYTYLAPGVFTVTLVATNIAGSDSVTHTVEVLSPACVPVSNADLSWAPTTPPVGLAVSFSGSADGDEPIAYAWSFGDGATGSGVTTTHTYATAGLYAVVMTASNCLTASDVVSYNLTVVAPHLAVSGVPTVTLGPGDIAAGVLALTNTGDYTLTWSLAELTPLGWLDESPTAGMLAAGAAQEVTLGYSAPVTPGIYSGVLRVTSDDPLQPQADVDVVLVVNELPPACAPVTGTAFIWSPASPYLSETVTLTATALGGEAPFTYTWALGDGTAAEGAVVTHAYTASGTYSVLLSATNCEGTTVVTATHEIVVEGPVPPHVYAVYLPIVLKGK